MLRVGVDIVDLKRLKRITARYHVRFMKTFMTEQELTVSRRMLSSIGCCLAAKEAVAKVLGVGLSYLSENGIDFRDVEVALAGKGGVDLSLKGKALEHAQKMNLTRWQATVSVELAYATAIVIAESAVAGNDVVTNLNAK